MKKQSNSQNNIYLIKTYINEKQEELNYMIKNLLDDPIKIVDPNVGFVP